MPLPIFATGQPLTAADANTLARQGVITVPTTTDRDNLPAPHEGMRAYVEADATLYLRSGGAWIPWERAWASYTPLLTAASTNPNLGSTGVATGAYAISGGTVFAKARLVFGGSGVSAGSGIYRVSLPPPLAPGSDVYLAVGEALIYDASANTSFVAVASLEASTLIGLRTHGTAGEVRDSSPMTFATSDQIRLNVQYRPA